MARPYTQKRRAEQQAETRQKIVEAAVELHTAVGPAHTTVSMVAERAGVQRHTFYAHFPDEWSLLLACSGHVLGRDPMPEAEAWRGIEAMNERLNAGLEAIYGWYARHAQLVGTVLRDGEHHEPTHRIIALRFGPVMAGYNEILGTGLSDGQRVMLSLALSFHTWQTLTGVGGLDQAGVSAAMVRAIMTA